MFLVSVFDFTALAGQRFIQVTLHAVVAEA